MKIVTYQHDGAPRLGAVLDDRVVDVARGAVAAGEAALTPALDVIAFLELGSHGVDAARRVVEHVAALDPVVSRREQLTVALAQALLLPPVPNPPKIVCVARNYAEHAKEAGREISEIPIVFARFPVTLVAPGAPIVRPTVSHELDWEGELAVVIGQGGRHISKAGAMDHVAGYSVFNDVTVRDYQFRVPQYTSGKNFRSTGPFGPYLVLKEDVPDPHALEITTRVNGETKQTGNTRDMLFDVPTIIEHISEWVDLEPGDVIPTGTPAGVGFKRTPPEFLCHGDTVEVTVDGVGTLINPVVDEAEAA